MKVNLTLKELEWIITGIYTANGESAYEHEETDVMIFARKLENIMKNTTTIGK